MSSDSEDDVPLAVRASKPDAKPAANGTSNTKAAPKAAPKSNSKANAKSESEDDDDFDDSEDVDSDDDDEDSASSSDDSDSDEEDDKPLAQRKAKKASPAASKKRKRTPTKKANAKKSKQTAKRSKSEPGKSKDGQIMWKTLKHSGVLFPPEYEPHGVKMLYDGKPVDLTQDQEEVATMFAVMKETDYMNKPVFLKNFWEGFSEVLGKKHVIQCLEKCDFTPIYEYLMADREKKKQMTKEVR